MTLQDFSFCHYSKRQLEIYLMFEVPARRTTQFRTGHFIFLCFLSCLDNAVLLVNKTSLHFRNFHGHVEFFSVSSLVSISFSGLVSCIIEFKLVFHADRTLQNFKNFSSGVGKNEHFGGTRH